MATGQSGQADEITISSSANFEFAANAVVLVNGNPTFLVDRSSSQLVVAGANISAVSGGTVTIENALFLGQFDVASIVAAGTVNLEAFDNSVTTGSLGTAPDITAGPFPLVYYALVTSGAPDQLVLRERLSRHAREALREVRARVADRHHDADARCAAHPI